MVEAELKKGKQAVSSNQKLSLLGESKLRFRGCGFQLDLHSYYDLFDLLLYGHVWTRGGCGRYADANRQIRRHDRQPDLRGTD